MNLLIQLCKGSRSPLAAILFVLTFQSSGVWAYVEPTKNITLKQATETAVSSFGGSVLKTETAERDGRSVYKIRLVNSGRVKVILVDIHSGKILNL